MPTVTKTFLLDTAGEYAEWTIDAIGDITISHETTTADADGIGGNGQFQSAMSTKNRNRTGHMRILQSWEDLGVPTGATVTHARVVYAGRQVVNVANCNSDSGPFEVRSADNSALTVELLNAFNRTAVSAYTDRDSGNIALPAPEASNAQHWFRLTTRLQTPNTTNAAITTHHDWIRITATYEVSAGGFVKVRIGGSWVEKPVKVRIGSSWVQKNVKVRVGAGWVLS